jgi:AcrR family transcriptional regulator
MSTRRKNGPAAQPGRVERRPAEGKAIRVRNSKATKEKIGKAALKEFTERGYDATTISMIARRAGVSKQLLCHHFPTKEDLFREVHDLRFREDVVKDAMPSEPADLMAERFRVRAQDADYVRFLTWEAASGRNSKIPGRDTRLHRIIEKASAIRELQQLGRIPPNLDHRLMQLAITSLATYPLAFRQITLLITGCDPTDERFQKEWYEFLQQLGQLIFRDDARKKGRSRSP